MRRTAGRPRPVPPFVVVKKWVKDARQIFFANAAAIVRDFYHGFLVKFRFAFAFGPPDTNRDLAFTFDGFDRIDDQIQHRVFDLRGVRHQFDVLRLAARTQCARDDRAPPR